MNEYQTIQKCIFCPYEIRARVYALVSKRKHGLAISGYNEQICFRAVCYSRSRREDGFFPIRENLYLNFNEIRS